MDYVATSSITTPVPNLSLLNDDRWRGRERGTWDGSGSWQGWRNKGAYRLNHRNPLLPDCALPLILYLCVPRYLLVRKVTWCCVKWVRSSVHMRTWKTTAQNWNASPTMSTLYNVTSSWYLYCKEYFSNCGQLLCWSRTLHLPRILHVQEEKHNNVIMLISKGSNKIYMLVKMWN